MTQSRRRKHHANGIEKAMFKRLSENISAEMRNVRQHLRFSIDPFDQTAYAFRHNGNMRPAVVNDLPGVFIPRSIMPKKPAAKRPAPPCKAVPDTAPADGESPVEYMLRVMRDPKATPSRRDTMAKSATPYIHPRPAPKKKRSSGDASLKKRLETARETLARKIVGLRSDCDAGVSG